eukprot:9113604-Alexandrium_andersonii.AAC.2
MHGDISSPKATRNVQGISRRGFDGHFGSQPLLASPRELCDNRLCESRQLREHCGSPDAQTN